METKEKMDTDSIVPKAEYASSEYSSEAPPAYKLRSANSVKIAKIIAFTIILSSFILGSFLLASTYLQAKATCDQVSALDAVLDKELMLEAMQQDLPRPEALQTREANNNVIQDLSKDEMNKPNKKDETNPDDVEAINTENEIDSHDSDERDDMRKIRVKLPLDFDLTELAHNLLMNNQKSRMNCVVERRRTEEMNENPMKAMNPFSALLDDEQPREKVTGERVSIFCETGDKKPETEPIVHVRRIIMPFPLGNMPGPMHHRFNPQMPPPQFQQAPPQFPMPQFQPQNQMNFFPPPPSPQIRPEMRMGPFQPPMPFPMPHPQQQPQMPQMPPQQQQQDVLPPIPASMMSPPRPEIPQFRLISPAPQQPNFERPQQEQENESMMPRPEVRIQLRRIQLPGPIGDIFPFLNNIQNDIQKEVEAPRPAVQVQQVPLAVALSKVGITPDDLRNIQRMAEERFQQHIRELVADEDDSSSGDSDSNQSEEEDEMKDLNIPTAAIPEEKSEDKAKEEVTEKPEKTEEERPQVLALNRANFGRSLQNQPIQLPMRPEIQEAERAESKIN
ncbi:hypothetical protein PVAND_007532 [Polypedilum vanderplanki]|uniref:Uncharacterized protein n=1 Tax=Polypedilum vanderplanki TaxID=319348 RepID=A0A9J6C6K9_POLVA|nr:hypothetical protein PVAND_007532 [Polypedilum vanderplanki]